MCRKSVLVTLRKISVGWLLLTSGISTAASQDIESGAWQLLSMPGNATGSVSSLFGDALSADTINSTWAVFTYNSNAGGYQRLESEDRINTSDAFWFAQYTGDSITVDLELAVDSPSLQSSDACVSASGCVEHDLNASGSVSWTLVGAPFTQSIPVSRLRLVTTNGICAQGCSIAAAREAGLTNGIFLGYDAATRRYVSLGEGDSLQPGSGYWFYNLLSADAGRATLLIPAPQSAPEPANANLLFRSGFESETTLSPILYGYQRLNGIELESGFVWDESLNGLWGSSNNGIHLIDGGGVAGGISNELQSVIGHDGEDTTALYQEIAFSNGSPTAQTPYQINNISEDPEEYYISYWIKIDDTSLDDPDQWRIVWQFKSDHFSYQHPEPGYRIGVYIYTDEDGPYWHVKGDDQNPDYWSVSDRQTPVPRDEWFRVEVYSKVSAGDDGRFWARINGTEIASHNGPNLGSTADSMYFMMLWQLYGNSYPGHQWIDDVEIWDGVPY